MSVMILFPAFSSVLPVHMLTLYIFATNPSFGPVFVKFCDYIALEGFICIKPSLLPAFMIIIICLFKIGTNRPWNFTSFQPNGVVCDI